MVNSSTCVRFAALVQAQWYDCSSDGDPTLKNVDTLITRFHKTTIVEAFNKFYSSVGPKLASKIPGGDLSPTSYIANSNPETILIPVTQEEVSKIILGLKDSSAGWDNIYSKIVKQTNQHRFPMLTHLFNLSLTKGIVPKELKIGKVVPIYKNESCMLVNNFRPVSVLPSFLRFWRD